MRQNPHAPFCGSRRRVTASGDPVLGMKFPGAYSAIATNRDPILGIRC